MPILSIVGADLLMGPGGPAGLGHLHQEPSGFRVAVREGTSG